MSRRRRRALPKPQHGARAVSTVVDEARASTLTPEQRDTDLRVAVARARARAIPSELDVALMPYVAGRMLGDLLIEQLARTGLLSRRP